MDFTELYNKYKWKPIHNCPGRFLLEMSCQQIFQKEFVNQINIQEFRVPKAKDIVLVLTLKNGGLISFLHDDGFILHTLNTTEGFLRKLKQLEIHM